MRQLQKNPVRRRYSWVAVALLASAVTAGGLAVSAAAATYEGAPVRLGDGFARTVVQTDSADKPTSIAVMLSLEALRGLPETPNSETQEGEWPYLLQMPQAGPDTGFKAAVIDWNAHGHMPAGVYDVPHFDIHFYLTDAKYIEAITFVGPGDPAAKVRDTALIPVGYQLVAETAINKMGVHAIDTGGSEFHGTPFTATFIYGYHNGRLIFLEPMITRDFLLTSPDFAAKVKTPANVSLSGHYPTGYSARYDAARQGWLVALDGLEYRQPNFGGPE